MKSLFDFCKYVLPCWIAIFFAIFFAILIVWPEFLSESWGWGIFFILIAIIFYSTIFNFIIEVEANTCITVQHKYKKDSNNVAVLTPKWPGFNWKSVFEFQKFKVETQKHKKTEDTGTWSSGDDLMTGKWKVLWQVDTSVDTRDENMLKYNKTTEENIDSDIKLFTNSKITNYCYNSGGADNAKSNKNNALLKSDFEGTDGICEKYGIKIVSCGIEDLDYSEELQKAKTLLRESKAIIDATKPFTEQNISMAEALKIVKAKILSGNYKQIEITNDTDAKVILNP